MMRTCSAPLCAVYSTNGLCRKHDQQIREHGRFVPTWPEEIPPVCICDIPIPDAIAMCADCLRPYKPRFAQLREAWREFYRIRGWELNMLEEGRMTHLYVKKPVIVEAAYLSEANAERVAEWVRANGGKMAHNAGLHIDTHAEIATLEGVMRADWGDYIIKGVKGEFYPCKPDVFAASYERAPLDAAAS